jgi:hypothetical protein
MKIVRQPTAASKALDDIIKTVDENSIKIGWSSSAKYEDGMPVAQAAIENELGNPIKQVPARAFIRPTINKQSNSWESLLTRGFKQVLKNVLTARNAMLLVGEKAAGDVKEAIRAVYSPPLASTTIAARLAKYKNKKKIGNLYKPLIDTGVMLNTISTEVTRDEK